MTIDLEECRKNFRQRLALAQDQREALRQRARHAAIEAIREDLEKPRPMDRLLCGDVGFGKTELAMRAAFKAAE
ncbi:MAG: hypothetical protein ACO3NK_17905, partial [Prochlorotrichaceae cyanobacterium]